MTQPLTNGQHVILEDTNSHGNTYILAQTENDFVTWAVNNVRDPFCSHYYPQTTDGLTDALRDFRNRVGA